MNDLELLVQKINGKLGNIDESLQEMIRAISDKSESTKEESGGRVGDIIDLDEEEIHEYLDIQEASIYLLLMDAFDDINRECVAKNGIINFNLFTTDYLVVVYKYPLGDSDHERILKSLRRRYSAGHIRLTGDVWVYQLQQAIEPKVYIVDVKGYDYPFACDKVRVKETGIECDIKYGRELEVPFDEIIRVKELTLNEYLEIEKKREELNNE